MPPQKSLREIYTTLQENQKNDLSYDDYVLVLDALEYRHRGGVLVESLCHEHDLVYWVEAVRVNRSTLNEWSLPDFTAIIDKTREKAKAAGTVVMQQAIDVVVKFKAAFSVTYDAFVALGAELKLDMTEVFNTLRERGLWDAVKVVNKLAINTIANTYTLYTTAYAEASRVIFGTIDQSKIGELLENGAAKLQQLVDSNPKLKIILGPIIAYTLYYIWTKMIFKGDFKYDFDWTMSIQAFTGDFDIVEIFSGQGGVELLTWFGLGLAEMFPTAAWLDGDLSKLFGGWGNHALALLATMLIYIHDHYPKVFDRPLVRAIKDRLCARDRQISLKPPAITALTALGVARSVYKPCGGPVCAG